VASRVALSSIQSFYATTCHHISEDDIFHNSDHDNLRLGIIFYFYLLVVGVRLGSLGMSTSFLSIVRIDNDEYEAVNGKRIDKGNRRIRRKFALVPLCPP
jgi:hypothetical protein